MGVRKYLVNPSLYHDWEERVHGLAQGRVRGLFSGLSAGRCGIFGDVP